MIIIKLQGGLGNQLFQWALGKSLSIELICETYLDLSFLNLTIPGITKRYFELDKFPYITEKPIMNKYKYFNFNVINDDSSIDNVNKNMNYYLDGYFQHKKYIAIYNDNISKLLQPDINNINIDKSLLEKIINTNSLSIHVRRTDYLTSKGFHPVQSIKYYNNAIDQVKNYDNIFIFSDDITWCKNNFIYENMHFIEGLSSTYDLWLMSLCKNNIIANSSFSWWAAYLNRNVNKIIVAPQKWFGSSKSDNDSLVMDGWIRIDS